MSISSAGVRRSTAPAPVAAFDDYGFCKHMVATALAANEIDPDLEPEGAGALARIRAHLAAKSAEALVAMILELARATRPFSASLRSPRPPKAPTRRPSRRA